MSKQVPKEDIKASKGVQEEGEGVKLGPTPEGARSARAIALGILIGALLWGLIGIAIFLLL